MIAKHLIRLATHRLELRLRKSKLDYPPTPSVKIETPTLFYQLSRNNFLQLLVIRYTSYTILMEHLGPRTLNDNSKYIYNQTDNDVNRLETLNIVSLTKPPFPANRPRILLVHGTMDRASSFRRMARYLSGFEVISYDRRGYGDSIAINGDGSPIKLTWRIHLEDLIGIAETKPTVIFGHSYGGTLSLLAAERGIQNILGLVTFEPPLPWEPRWARWPNYELSPEEDIDPKWAAGEVDKFMSEMAGDTTWKRLPPSVKEKRRSEGVTMISEMSSLSHIDKPLDPTKVLIPLLIGRSEHAQTRHKEISDYLLSKVPNSQLEIVSDTGHGVHLIRPQRAAELVKELMDKLLNR